ncbi:MAG TPA: RHS repeat-associated core domain-containing protein [Burkholderiaceae bacterium]|nr:RHS repeat-associated core domain-containing protein [Burkholderiaceae bacterium]
MATKQVVACRYLLLGLAALLGLSAPRVASAQVENYSYIQGLGLRAADGAVTAHGTDILGDKVNLYSGALEFEQTDLELHGNSKLRVAVTRKHTAGRSRPAGVFGNWDLDVPRIAGNFTDSPGWVTTAGSTARCSTYSEPPAVGFVSAFQYWQGTFLHAPGEGGQEILKRATGNTVAPTDGFSYPLITRGHWQIRCLPSIQNGAGEGFVARSPSGDEYRFDWMAQRSLYSVKNQTTTVLRSEFMLLATQVTDRFGNWVQYAYDAANPMRLTGISASDGRAVTLTYGSNGFVSTVSDGSRTWNYVYGVSTDLTAVVLPDASRWEFNLTPLVHTNRLELGEGATCDVPGTYPEGTYTGTVKHPSGLLGTFTTQFLGQPRSNVSRWCFGPAPSGSGARWPKLLVSQGLTSKVLSGPGIATSTWTYAYAGSNASWAPCSPCVDTKTVTVTDPLGVQTRYTFGVRFQSNEGQLLSTQEGWDGTSALRTTTNRYRDPAGMSYPEPPGNSIQGAPDNLSIRHRPMDQRVTTLQGATFTWEATAGATGFDQFARVASATQSSSLGFSRGELTQYEDNLARWVIGQVRSTTESTTGLVPESRTYDATTALLTARYLFGRLAETYQHNADGTMASITDGLNHTTTFTNYMRGVPQHIGYADGTGITAAVNNIGAITSVTNEAGTTWNYGYDTMGRLASKTPPGGDAVTYNPTNLSFVQVPTDEVGIEAGHWRQTITTGNAVTINYFDARWRKRLTTTYDANDRANTERSQRFDYDPYNRTSFAAYPARSIPTITTATPGTSTTYDALGRPTQTVSDSELGALTTTTQYLAGFQKRITDARGNATTTGYQAFDEPSKSAIATITAPEGLSVTISRDVFGKPLSIARSGTYGGSSVSATRSYVYDANQLLCKTVEPETGATIQALDAANNVAWRAPGLNLTNTGSCDWGSVPAANIVSHTYDARNRVTVTGFGDGGWTIWRTYTADGLPATVASGGSVWTYGYNNRRLLTSESLAYGQTFNVGRSYDVNGNLSQVTYPDNTVVTFGPNALGEATQVSDYASAVSYHPNGAVAGYTLGNGIVHTLTQNIRGLPSVNRDAGVVQDLYSYDANGNITAIVDQQEGVSSRTMGPYDGLDRLTSVSAPSLWGSAAYTYDVLGNMRTSVVGSRNSTHNYGGNNLLATINTNGLYTGYAYDARGNVTGRGNQGFYFDLGNRMMLANGVASYIYDGWGRRVSVNGTNGLTRTQVYSQAGQLLYGQSRQGLNTWLTRYVYLGGKLIAETDSSADTSFAHDDALGSPVARTNSAGQVTSRTRYESYGATAAGTNPGSSGFTGIGFTGHVNEPETGLVYMQQRYYDPIAARFLSLDPIAADPNTGDHFNRYEYANNSPYRYTDRDGRGPVRDNSEFASSGAGIGSAEMLFGRGIDGRTYQPSPSESQAILRGMRDELAAKGGTYILKDADGTVVKTGRTNNLARREAEHGRNHPDKTFEVDKRTDNKAAQRGREQDLHDANPSAHEANGGMDKINGIAPSNPKRDEYLKAGRALP